jgi:hypothetical protein
MIAEIEDYINSQSCPVPVVIPTNVSEFVNDAGYITSADIPTDANSVVEVVNATFNTTTNTPVPTIVGNHNQDTAHVICNNGSAYFNWNGTEWVFTSFIAKFSLQDIPEANATTTGLVNTNTTTAQQLGNGNKIIKGSSTTTGNALQVINSAGQSIAEFRNDKVVAMANNTLLFFEDTGNNAGRIQTTKNILFLTVGSSTFYFINNRIYPASGNLQLGGQSIPQTLTLKGNTYGVGIGNNIVPHNDVSFQVQTGNQVSMPYPRLTSAQRLAIPQSVAILGGMVYQTDGVEGLYIYKSTGWTFVI